MPQLQPRQAMVTNQLMPNGVADERLLHAMLDTPREEFLPEQLAPIACCDTPLTLPGGRSLMPPVLLGQLLQQAVPAPEDSVLILGGATGYSAAVVAQLAKKVVMVEPDHALFDAAQAALQKLHIQNVEVYCQNLADGAALQAPFDLILIEGGFTKVPDALLRQLGNDGTLLGIEIAKESLNGALGAGEAVQYRRQGEEWKKTSLFDAAHPCLPWQQGAKRVFTF